MTERVLNANRICVRNISAQVRRDELEELFKQHGLISEFTYIDRRGLAFIEYTEGEAADKAIQEANGMLLQDQTIAVSKADENRQRRRQHTGFLGNLPVTASREDVEQFLEGLNFADVRMIKHRESGEFRGFCYVDFTSQDELDKFLRRNGEKYMDRDIRADIGQTSGGGRTPRSPRGGGARYQRHEPYPRQYDERDRRPRDDDRRYDRPSRGYPSSYGPSREYRSRYDAPQEYGYGYYPPAPEADRGYYEHGRRDDKDVRDYGDDRDYRDGRDLRYVPRDRDYREGREYRDVPRDRDYREGREYRDAPRDRDYRHGRDIPRGEYRSNDRERGYRADR